MRRISPILSDILPALKGGLDVSKLTSAEAVAALPEDQKFDVAAKFLGPIMNGMSKLSDADADLVLFGLLSCVEVQQAAGNWAKVATPVMIMIQDMELPVLLQIAGRSFMFNLSGFFTVLQQ